MTGFTKLKGKAAPLDQANIDTDQIIPKQFLTGVTRSGYGKHLFHDWRYLDLHEQEVNPEFPLTKSQHKGANILLARENFGCGSSREHAPWALADFGFGCIIATSFADIFYSNCINNQLLPVVLPSKDMDELFAKVSDNPDIIFFVNLPEQSVQVGEKTYTFDMVEHHKQNMIKGLDAIGQTLELDTSISHFEGKRAAWL
ncbi:MAG: 3-isopropylmalate/(R)-2-methylmalate dehydratase small subunit [Gammaproteobacteria bacterium]|jgi:3-isopropylmalate/(R)-2-methylmalate dehydratase small subunit